MTTASFVLELRTSYLFGQDEAARSSREGGDTWEGVWGMQGSHLQVVKRGRKVTHRERAGDARPPKKEQRLGL